MDFQDGLDLIDLSGYHQVGTMDDLFIKTREWGVLTEIRGEKIKIIAADATGSYAPPIPLSSRLLWGIIL